MLQGLIYDSLSSLDCKFVVWELRSLRDTTSMAIKICTSMRCPLLIKLFLKIYDNLNSIVQMSQGSERDDSLR
jgi:hypothetical protein